VALQMDCLANQTGAVGEAFLIITIDEWLPRPKGQQLKNRLTALENIGITIKRLSFDAISLPLQKAKCLHLNH
jgi:hypothetical protein